MGSLRQRRIGAQRISFYEAGCGPRVILVHGSSSSHRIWKRFADSISDRYEVRAPDLIGYGQSAPWELPSPFDLEADARVVAGPGRGRTSPHRRAFLRRSHGAGAARILGGNVSGLTLIEPVSFHLLKTTGFEKEWAVIERLAEDVVRLVGDRRHAKATARYMGFWMGRIRYRFMPRRIREGVIRTVSKVAQEFGGLTRVAVGPEDYGPVTSPILVLVGIRTRQPAKAAAEAVRRVIPSTRVGGWKVPDT